MTYAALWPMSDVGGLISHPSWGGVRRPCFLLALIELFSLGVMAEELQAIIG